MAGHAPQSAEHHAAQARWQYHFALYDLEMRRRSERAMRNATWALVIVSAVLVVVTLGGLLGWLGG